MVKKTVYFISFTRPDGKRRFIGSGTYIGRKKPFDRATVRKITPQDNGRLKWGVFEGGRRKR
ncbi:hypothetical protein KAR91_06945 [Candidatus Pacearchaeota archaeon]|nr:hypothetical protein [Candidatus Pacearchaeota archaeon]